MKVHLIAIGGSAMHNLALALKEIGHEVSGSDDEIFEPSKSRLNDAGLLPMQMGWNENHIQADLDFVIVGMHARQDNPELKKALDLKLNVVSYPEFIYQQCKNKTRVVIAGSHGKTSITAMILHALHYHGRDCDYMVGAQLKGFNTMVKLTKHNEFVLLEGDEYLSSPIDPRPKFLHYKPNIALISGIAWDHVNVFPTYQSYLDQFELLLNTMDTGGTLIYNEQDEEVIKLVANNKDEIKKFAYGLPDYQISHEGFVLNTFEGDIPLKFFGKHNMNNLEGARWICNQMGLTDEEFYEAIAEFQGASKRLELIYESAGKKVFLDFAHAPSKVKATVNATKEAFASKKLVACLELHTFSSLNIDFIKNYRSCLDEADFGLVYFNPEVLKHKKLPNLSVKDIQNAFDNQNLKVANSSNEVREFIKKHNAENSNYLLMSSGNFDGIDWRSEIFEMIG